MLNTLLLISVLILSLFLPFYCIDFHKNTILSIVNMEKNNNEEEVVTIEDASTQKSVVYVEELAKMSEENITAKSVDVVPKEEIIPINEEVKEENITQEKIDIAVEEPVLKKSENNDLDHLEKLILEELNREKKD